MPESPSSPRPVSFMDSWWWSPSFMTVAGLAIAGLQVEPYLQGVQAPANYLMIALGLGLAGYGVFRLRRARPAPRLQQPSDAGTGPDTTTD